MKTSQYSIITMLLTFFLMTSCKEVRKSIDETLHPVAQKKQKPADDKTSSSSSVSFSSSTVFSSTSEEYAKSIFESAAALDSIQLALYNMPHLKGKKLFFMAGFYFYDYRGGMISVDLQDPDKPENVDTYTYSNGAWEIQKPVKMTGMQHFPLEMLLMPLDEVKFSTAKKVYDIAVEKSKTIEGAEPIQFVYFSQIKAVHVKEWYVMIQGARRNYRITFDVNGNLRGEK
ncbi:hypothetical protein L3C95_18240 [Chitinophaga filiformis]|uniref:hypothetical protein n=1 Tax=Chitinophaga filiformis TaxID=104663 RepID=UPI001F1F5530|nr:hypothetical protein [Chitinophaga filiformis]MCF6404845.1 hypothetical protein [Chitinophaga filiformis]